MCCIEEQEQSRRTGALFSTSNILSMSISSPVFLVTNFPRDSTESLSTPDYCNVRNGNQPTWRYVVDSSTNPLYVKCRHSYLGLKHLKCRDDAYESACVLLLLPILFRSHSGATSNKSAHFEWVLLPNCAGYHYIHIVQGVVVPNIGCSPTLLGLSWRPLEMERGLWKMGEDSSLSMCLALWESHVRAAYSRMGLTKVV